MNPLVQHEQSLLHNGSLCYYGALCQQNPAALVSLNRLLNAHSFDTIIELGTHTAGLSLPLALYCRLSKSPLTSTDPNEAARFVNRTHHKNPKRFFTFDNVERDMSAHRILRDLGAFAMIQDTLFDQHGIDGIRSLIENPASGTVLLLCDGGNKKMELELYGGSLKSGDFVMLHDWALDAAHFEHHKREGRWFSHEVMWEDEAGEGRQFGIKTLCESYDIEPIYADEFDRVAWFCGRKS